MGWGHSWSARLRCAARGSRRSLVCVVALLAAASSTAQVHDTPVAASTLKAAFLYKFASYVEWPGAPKSADTPITIGVAGADPFAGGAAEITRGRTVAGRPISVRRMMAGDPFDDLQILRQRPSARASERGLLADARSRPILTVTETAGALAEGSIINFTQDKDRVRFEISLYAAEQSQLKLNSRLLAVADSVHRGPE